MVRQDDDVDDDDEEDANDVKFFNPREVCGTYYGEDWTNIKLEFEELSLLEGTRKISRI